VQAYWYNNYNKRRSEFFIFVIYGYYCHRVQVEDMEGNDEHELKEYSNTDEDNKIISPIQFHSSDLSDNLYDQV
jgi:hypothetical protein